MVDPKKAAKLIRQHFEELTTEKFVKNLRSLSHETDITPKIIEQPLQKKAEMTPKT